MSNLHEAIKSELVNLIDSDYVYLDLPYYENIGDVLIWEGTEQFLSKLPYKCIYKTSASNFEYRPLDKNTTIIFQGGGNFGDLYPELQGFRKKILQLYPDNRIIILPQTVYYEQWHHMRQDYPVFASHKHLTICARDKYSYNLLKMVGMAKDIRLVPDMAFCIDPKSLDRYRQPKEQCTLFVSRVDKELGNKNAHGQISADVIQDWPTYMEQDVLVKELYDQLRDSSIDREAIDIFADTIFRPHLVKVGTEFISKFNKIYTTRLHAAILSVILGKDLVILDNSYGKNSNFYKTWLKDVDNVDCITFNTQSLFDFKLFANIIKSRIDVLRKKLALYSKIKSIFFSIKPKC